MIGWRKVSGWLIPLFSVAVVSSFGANLQTTLEGKVEEIKDPPAGIKGVEVSVLDGKGQSLKTALTDSEGAYTVRGLPRGTSVSIKLIKNGYKENPTVVDKVKLIAETTLAPKVVMILSQGNEKYYAGVAKEIQRRLRGNPAEGKKFQTLLESLGSTERAMVNQNLRGYAMRGGGGAFDPSLGTAEVRQPVINPVAAGPPPP
jgi:hypothetical protein